MERFDKIDRLLRSQCAVTKKAFLDELEVSEAAFRRDFEYMRERLFAPIIYDGA